MNYKDSKKAIKAQVDPDWQKTMEELLPTRGGVLPPRSYKDLERPQCQVDIGVWTV